MSLPPVVSPSEWQAARDELLVEEKQMTRAMDALAAKRRRLPMVALDTPYVFEGSRGKVSLADIFEGRRQLVVYHFMLGPGSDHICVGCASFTDNIGHVEHLQARDTTFALMSRAPLNEINAVKTRFGWTMPWYSSFGSDFNVDMGLTRNDREGFALNAYLRDGDRVFKTYSTSARGVDRIRVDFNLLDITALGRQEAWEDSPDGWPQTPTMRWLRLHDEYDA